MNRNVFFLILGLSAVLLGLQASGPEPAYAGAPLKINYQGRLEESGQPAEGLKNFVFKIYDAPAGGGLVWTSQAQNVAVYNGIFSVTLEAGAAVNLSTAVFSGARYLEIAVNGVSLAPRQEMVSAPYALVAQALAADALVAFSTAAVVSGKFGDDRVAISTGAFPGGFNGPDQLARLDGSGRLAAGTAVAGAISLPIKTITFAESPYTVTADDSTILVNAAAGQVLLNLPSAAGMAGRIYTVKTINATNPAKIVPDGDETLEGWPAATPYTLGDLGDYVTFQSDGANWLIIGSYSIALGLGGLWF